MKPKLCATLILACAIYCSCNNAGDAATVSSQKSSTPSNTLEGLTGTWQMEDGKNYERWTKSGNGFHVVVFSVTHTDTSWKEDGYVFQENGNWVFENRVKGQNDGRAVRFTETAFDSTGITFSNPAHDFPTDIHYSLNSPIAVHAYIAGPNGKGGIDTFSYNYKRVQ